jgi:hypothetical protein
MARHHDRLIADSTPIPKPTPLPTRPLTRPEIENLIRATVLAQGAVITPAGIRRITDAWLLDATLTRQQAAGDGCVYTGGGGCYYG